MADIQDYKSTPKFETFSYLPAMTPEKTRRQIAYIVSQGWNPGIEHVEPSRAFNYYWYMWKLPMFGEQSVDVIIAELEACVDARNEGREIEREGKEILANAAKTSPELKIAMETWKEIKFEFDTVDKLDVVNR